MSTEESFTIHFWGEKIFRGTPVPLEETRQPTLEGALAALERFYEGFNTRSLEMMRQNWLETSLAQLDNPVGGIKRGLPAILEVYTRIFTGITRVRVEFFDVVTYLSSTMVVFAGRERGTYEQNGKAAPLDIRTSRIFAYLSEQGGWRQVHHHGSIDNAERLARYVQAIRGS